MASGSIPDASISGERTIIGHALRSSEVGAATFYLKEKKMEKLKPCPHCGTHDLKECGMTGPQMNDGRNDERADSIDHEHAIKKWNELPRNEECFPSESIKVNKPAYLLVDYDHRNIDEFLSKKALQNHLLYLIQQGEPINDYCFYDIENREFLETELKIDLI